MPLCNWLALALNSKGEGWMGSRREINELAEAKTRIIGVGQFLKQRDINFCFFFLHHRISYNRFVSVNNDRKRFVSFSRLKKNDRESR